MEKHDEYASILKRAIEENDLQSDIMFARQLEKFWYDLNENEQSNLLRLLNYTYWSGVCRGERNANLKMHFISFLKEDSNAQMS